MKRLLAAIAIAVSACSAGMPVAVGPSRPELLAIETSANVLVHMHIVSSIGGEVIEDTDGYCSGVVLGPHVIATAGHCVDKPESLFPGETVSMTVSIARPDSNANVRNGELAETPADTFVVDKTADVAVLSVTGAEFAGAVALGDEPSRASHVSSVTNSRLMIDTYAEGFVAGLRKRSLSSGSPARPFLQTSVPIGKGASGGGLFDDTGHLVGICSHTDGTYSYWASVESLRKLLDSLPH